MQPINEWLKTIRWTDNVRPVSGDAAEQAIAAVEGVAKHEAAVCDWLAKKLKEEA